MKEKESRKMDAKKIIYNDKMLNRMRKKRAGFILNGDYIPFHEAEEKKGGGHQKNKIRKSWHLV